VELVTAYLDGALPSAECVIGGNIEGLDHQCFIPFLDHLIHRLW
jgi:hypothetical protein